MSNPLVKTEVADRLVAIIRPILTEELSKNNTFLTETTAALAEIQTKLEAIGKAMDRQNAIVARLDTIETTITAATGHYKDLESRIVALETANRMKKVAPGLIIDDRRPENLFQPNSDY